MFVEFHKHPLLNFLIGSIGSTYFHNSVAKNMDNVDAGCDLLVQFWPPFLSAFPGFSPVCFPFSKTTLPLTMTYSIPSLYWKGCVYVDRSMIRPASKRVMSAKFPSCNKPRSRIPTLAAFKRCHFANGIFQRQ